MMLQQHLAVIKSSGQAAVGTCSSEGGHHIPSVSHPGLLRRALMTMAQKKLVNEIPSASF